MKTRRLLFAVPFFLLGLFAYTQLTFFVVQPIGAVPDGRTVLIWRREKTKFIDSADAVCQREMGGVNLLCRGAVIGGIVGTDGNGILLRLPYIETLYLISTGGMKYDK
ncbi:MAG: hypothetical protein ABIR70_21790 [Bryobacteraceae bacterium]